MTTKGHDIIGVFARHKVAANLLMILMILSGLFALLQLNKQFLPTFALDIVTVKITWRGASAEDVEYAISNRVERQLRTIAFVKEMTSTSSYGSSSVRLEFEEGTNMGKALDEVKEKVDQLRNLPSEAETPDVRLVTRYEDVARIIMTTDGELDELRYLAHQIENDLLDRGISRVTISGLPEEEIAVQISAKKLESLGLSLNDVSQRIDDLSLDLPAGEIGNDDTARQLRSLGQRRDVQAFSQLPLKSDISSQLLLGDVANIERRSLPKQVSLFYQGKPAIEFIIERTENADAIDSARILDKWFADTQYTLPKGVDVKMYDSDWKAIQERMNLLLKNGLGGLVLVIIVLFLFLHRSVAIWVTAGIPVSFMATLFIMYLFGGTINMVSMFGLIMALGIIVDDAIVVGEDSLSRYKKGKPPLVAAEGGARQMFPPVIASSLTTISAFIPLMMVGDTIGNIMFDIPFVVVCVIAASLVESFLVLPGHLSHSFHRSHDNKSSTVRDWLDAKFNYFRDEVFRPVVAVAINHRWTTINIALGLLIMCIGLLESDRLRFTFFPSPESVNISANVKFNAGTPAYRVAEFLDHVNWALDRTTVELGDDLVEVGVTRLGRADRAGARGSPSKGERFGSIRIELVSPDSRDVRNREFIATWRKYITLPAGIETFTISERRGGPPGGDIDIRLTGQSARTLKKAANQVAEALKQFDGVSAIENDMPYGQEQLIYSINGLGDTLGLTISNVGQQLRAAFDGKLVQIFQDASDEVEVRVMLPDDERNTLATLENFVLRLPGGNSIPLSSVVNFESKRGFDFLRHTNGKLAVHITAAVDDAVNNANMILGAMQAGMLADLSAQYDIDIVLEGKSEEQADTMSDMRQGMVLAFVLVYLILAWVFSSYGWPLVVMAAIPFGLIGALAGHWLLGINMSMFSLFGMLGLSGIVVNDSIILITFFRQQRERGVAVTEAIINAATQRLRAVLLTSLTTIAGLTPLLFETSVQAQFLIPMAVSISFGLLFATMLVLIVIPALLSIHESAVDKFASRYKVFRSTLLP